MRYCMNDSFSGRYGRILWKFGEDGMNLREHGALCLS
jgi:hypothetical protein